MINVAIRYPIVLSTTEPNNDIGLIKIRQADEQSQTLVIQIMENGVPRSFSGLQPFFCARIGQAPGLGIIEQKIEGVMDPANGKLEYTLKNEDWQNLGKQTAYISFRRMKDRSTYVQQFTTRDFTYEVIKNIYSEGITEVRKDGSTYVWTFEDLLRLLNEYIDSGKNDWEEFVNQNKDLIGSVDPGGILLKEIIEARKPDGQTPFPQLKSRLDVNDEKVNQIDPSAAKAILAYQSDQSSEIGGFIPRDYSQRIFEIAEATTDSTFNIIFITDVHHQLSSYAPNSLAHYGYVADLSRTGSIQTIISGGDNINGWYNRNQLMVETRQATSALFNRSNFDTDVFFLFGNHDNGAGQNEKIKPEQCLSIAEIKNFYQTNTKIYDEKRLGDSLYFYKDYEQHKIRVIGLNAFDLPESTNDDGTYKYDFLHQSAFSGDQLKWLAEQALILPDNTWQVVIFTHACISGSLDTIPQYNTYELVQILNAFQNGEPVAFDADNELPVKLSADYSQQGIGTIIAVISGHKHADGITEFNGFKCVESMASLCYSGDKGREKDTYTEDSWDVFLIDPRTQHVEIKRFGAGEDRSFDY